MKGDFGRLGVVAVEVQHHGRQPGGRAAPGGARQVRAEFGQALHPDSRFAQRAQFGRLGVGAEELDVFAHRVFELLVAGQLAGREPKSRAALRLAAAYSMPSSTTSRAAVAAMASVSGAHVAPPGVSIMAA
jgi:hypothetical protein